MLRSLVNLIVTFLVLFNLNKCIKNTTSLNDEVFYRHYFLVIAVLFSLENFLSFILDRLPYYQLFKLITIGFISIPNNKGPYFIYNIYLTQIHMLTDGYFLKFFLFIQKTLEKIPAKYSSIASVSTVMRDSILENSSKIPNYLKMMIKNRHSTSKVGFSVEGGKLGYLNKHATTLESSQLVEGDQIVETEVIKTFSPEVDSTKEIKEADGSKLTTSLN